MSSKYQRKRQNERVPKRVFICCEDSVREPKYFHEYINYYKISESQVKVLSREDTASSPNRVYQRVTEFIDGLKERDDYYSTDEFWIVIDVDRWGSMLSNVTTDCHPKDIQCSISNPCFEIWLLLHYKNAGEIDHNPQEYSKASINSILSEYRLSGKNEKDYFPKTDEAIETAEQLDSNPQDRWPQKTGTRIYLLMKNLKLLIRE